MRKKTVALFLCGVFLFFCGFQGAPAWGQTRHVVTTSDSGAGSLRQAILDAVSGDVIDFDAGLTSGGAATITLSSGQLEIDKNLEIQGPGAGTLTVSGNGANRIFYVTEGTSAVISGLRLASGDVSSDATVGGAIFSYGDLRLADLVIEDNFAPMGGGGIYSMGTSLEIERCRFQGNATTIDTNAGRTGGAIYHFKGPFSLKDSTVKDNSAVRGGGLFLSLFGTSNALIEGCTFSGNSARGGGGAMVEGYPGSSGATVFRNSTFYGNDANEGGSTSGGGGVWSWNSEGPVRFENCTITRNSAGGYGAGVRVNGLSVAFKNSIVYQNILTNVNASFYRDLGQDASVVTDEGYNIIGMSFNNSFSWASTTLYYGDGTVPYNEIQEGIDVRLGALADNGGPTFTCALPAGSVAIDAVPGAQGYPATDQRGISRPFGTAADIGAFEYEPLGPGADFDGNGMGEVNTAIAGMLPSGENLPIEKLEVEFGAVSGGENPVVVNGQTLVFLAGGGIDGENSGAGWAEGATGVDFETFLGGAGFHLATSGDPTEGDTDKVGAVLVRVAMTLTSADLLESGVSPEDIESLFDGSVSDDAVAEGFFSRFTYFKAFDGADPALEPVDLGAFLKERYPEGLPGFVEFSRDLNRDEVTVGITYALLDESPSGEPLFLEDIAWELGGESVEGLLVVYDGNRDGVFRDPLVLGAGTLSGEECAEGGSGGCTTFPPLSLFVLLVIPLGAFLRKGR